jgi:hypothetical protein
VDPKRMVLYWHDYQAEAQEPKAVEDLIRAPILTFAVDPVVE